MLSSLLSAVKLALEAPLSLILYLLALLALYLALLVTYRLTLHPLARYPGPLLARITPLWQTYHAWKGDRHLVLYRAHLDYGK